MLIALSTMLLTTACSSEDDLVNNTANTENTINKGYALPVTVNVTREGDAGTRATFDGSKLAFSAGDKLFVRGNYDHWTKMFAGTLDYDAESGKFKGTIYTEDDTYKTYEDLFGNSDDVIATLLPAGYEGHGYLVINTRGTEEKYDDLLVIRNEYTLATSKADGVAQFSNEQSSSYSNGFALSPDNAILNFTITGLAASTSVNVSLTSLAYNITGTVTTDASGNATFAAGIMGGINLQPFSLTVGGNPITLVSSEKTLEAGKIYNITRSKVTDLSSLTGNYTALNGETLTGTLTGNYKISIADGATVTLDGVTITNLGNGCDWAGINCPGDATIILKGDNEVCAGRDGYDCNNYPGIWIAPSKTLNIMGDGSLTAYSDATDPSGAGIGGGWDIDCGNINISGGTINATGGDNAAGIGGGDTGACGTITISGGTISATGGTNSPGIGSGDHGSCAGITISGGTVTARSSTNQSTAIGRGVGGSCTSVTITTGITSLTMTNSYAYVNGFVSDFINATAVNANTTPITSALSTSVTDPTITGGMTSAGFATSYDGGTKTWTITKK